MIASSVSRENRRRIKIQAKKLNVSPKTVEIFDLVNASAQTTSLHINDDASATPEVSRDHFSELTRLIFNAKL